WARLGRDDIDPVPQLLVGDRRRLPGLNARLVRDLSAGSSLRNVRIISRSASGRPGCFVTAEPTPGASPENVRHVEDGTVVAPDRKVVGIAVSDRACRI